ncbi:MAG: TatD family hydrolase [gamma proteobacterium symbiont of Taylorina sp.]|nr:TatD family hydrolase [gamma proteobacterium symbiont of Taylorina sp.]
MSLNFVDSHCHLDMLDLSEFSNHMDSVIERAKEHHVKELLSISVDLDSFPRVLETARNYSDVYASVGLHPCHSPEKITSVDELVGLSGDPKVIAIGETGLDYYMNKGSDPLNNKFFWQRERFRTHIRAAIETQKPLIIHTRDARQDTLRVLQEENAHQVGGIMHCFVEDMESAEKALEMGFYISFSGIVTFKNAKEIQAVAKAIPDNRILIETDSPYLAPVPMRGKKNQPAYVSYVAKFLADLRGTSLEQFAEISSKNFYRLFNL